MNGTRPQTIAAALSDSPVGQLAYNELFENFGNGTSLVTPEQVLTQVSLYWLTNTSATAVRYHYAEAHAGRRSRPEVSHGRIGVAVFADDFKTMRPLAERDNTGIVHWSEFDRGRAFRRARGAGGRRRRPAGRSSAQARPEAARPGRGPAGGVDQAEEQAVVVAALRMPLDAEPERPVGVLHRLDRAVGGPGGDLEARVTATAWW